MALELLLELPRTYPEMYGIRLQPTMVYKKNIPTCIRTIPLHTAMEPVSNIAIAKEKSQVALLDISNRSTVSNILKYIDKYQYLLHFMPHKIVTLAIRS